MKSIIICLLVALNTSIASWKDAETRIALRTASISQTFRDSCDSIPQPLGFVNDFEHILKPGQINVLNETIREYEDSTGNQVAIVTIPTSMVKYANFERFTFRLLNCWGVGLKFRNNGILIGISAGYKRIRIQNGHGIEKVLSNAETKKIIDLIFVPNFKKGNYYDGIFYGLKAIMSQVPRV